MKFFYRFSLILVVILFSLDPAFVMGQNNDFTLYKTLSGYDGLCWDVQFSPGGNYLALSTDYAGVDVFNDKWKKVWSRPEVGTTECPPRLAFSTDDQFLAIGCGDDISILRLEDKKIIQEFYSPTSVWGIAFSPDGNYLAATGPSGEGKIWQRSDDLFVELQTIDEKSNIWSVIFSPDGKFLITGEDRQTTRIWQKSGDKFVIGQTLDITGKSLSFSPDGQILTVSNGGSVTFFQFEEGNFVKKHSVPGGGNDVFYSPDGQFIAGCGRNVVIWQQKGDTIEEIQAIPAHNDAIINISVSVDGEYLASASWDKTVKIWADKSVSSDGQYIALDEKSDPAVTISNTVTNARSTCLPSSPGLQQTHALAFVPGKDQIVKAFGTPNSSIIQLWNIQNKSMIRELTLSNPDVVVKDMSISADGRFLAVADGTPQVKFFDLETGQEVTKLNSFIEDIHTVAYSSDGQHFYYGADDGTIRCYATSDDSIYEPAIMDKKNGIFGFNHSEKGMIPQSYEDEGYPPPDSEAKVRCLSISSDGRYIISGGTDHSAIIWDTQTADIHQQLFEHKHDLTDVSFSQDGRFVATAGLDRFIKVWDAQTGQSFWEQMFTRVPSCLAFLPDGRLVTGDVNDQGQLTILDVGLTRQTSVSDDLSFGDGAFPRNLEKPGLVENQLGQISPHMEGINLYQQAQKYREQLDYNSAVQYFSRAKEMLGGDLKNYPNDQCLLYYYELAEYHNVTLAEDLFHTFPEGDSYKQIADAAWDCDAEKPEVMGITITQAALNEYLDLRINETISPDEKIIAISKVNPVYLPIAFEGMVMIYAGQHYMEKEDHENAVKFFEIGLTIYDLLSDNKFPIEIDVYGVGLLGLAGSYIRANQVEEAQRMIDRAISVGKAYNDMTLVSAAEEMQFIIDSESPDQKTAKEIQHPKEEKMETQQSASDPFSNLSKSELNKLLQEKNDELERTNNAWANDYQLENLRNGKWHDLDQLEARGIKTYSKKYKETEAFYDREISDITSKYKTKIKNLEKDIDKIERALNKFSSPSSTPKASESSSSSYSTPSKPAHTPPLSSSTASQSYSSGSSSSSTSASHSTSAKEKEGEPEPGTIKGHVKLPDGDDAENYTVVIDGGSRGNKHEVQTDGYSGKFEKRGLEPGSYSISVEEKKITHKTGYIVYGTKRSEKVRLAAGDTETVNVRLEKVDGEEEKDCDDITIKGRVTAPDWTKDFTVKVTYKREATQFGYDIEEVDTKYSGEYTFRTEICGSKVITLECEYYSEENKKKYRAKRDITVNAGQTKSGIDLKLN